MYGAVYGWLLKIGVSLALAFSGFILVLAGVVPGAETQSMEAIRNLRILFSTVPFVFILAAIVLMARYPLTERQVNLIKEKLSSKKPMEHAE